MKGSSHSNPYLDTHIDDVEFMDGTIKQYAANVIAENILSQVDSEGRQYLMLDEIMDHRMLDTALHKDDAYVVTT